MSQELTTNVVPGAIQTLTYSYSKFFIEPEEDVVKDSLRMDLYISGMYLDQLTYLFKKKILAYSDLLPNISLVFRLAVSGGVDIS